MTRKDVERRQLHTALLVGLVVTIGAGAALGIASGPWTWIVAVCIVAWLWGGMLVLDHVTAKEQSAAESQGYVAGASTSEALFYEALFYVAFCAMAWPVVLNFSRTSENLEGGEE